MTAKFSWLQWLLHFHDPARGFARARAAALESPARSEDELWAGYPAILLYGRPHQRWSQPKFAPLLMRRVTVVEDGGIRFLEPLGPAQPHPDSSLSHSSNLDTRV